MDTIEARVAQLETKVDNHAAAVADLKALMERRFDAIDRRFEAFDRRFEAIDHRFLWVIGMQFATLLALVAAMGGIVASLL